MTFKSLHILFLLSLILTQFGCKRSKIQKSIAELPKGEITVIDSSSAILKPTQLIIFENDFKYLKLKSKVDFHSENISQSFPANVHIKKDSIIWISVSLGIEAARVMITKDSIQFMDKINRQYYSLSIAEINEEFNFDFDFSILQSLLVGNLPFERNEEDLVERNSLYTSLFQQQGNVKIENQIDNVSHKLTTILAEDMNERSKLGVSYSDFLEVTLGRPPVPHSIFTKIDVFKNGLKKTSTLDFRHTRFDFLDTELRFPYTIPKSFKKGEIVF